MKFEKNIKNGLYLISDENLLKRKDFILSVKKALASGIKIIQIREKKSSLKDRMTLCSEVSKLAKLYKAELIINDDPFLAKLCKAKGVHIGKNDGSVKRAREILGKDAYIGVSCYGDINSALKSQQDGADYVSFGNFYFSQVKPEEKIEDLSVIKKAKERLKIPVLAIGGINENNCSEVFAAGADAVCCVSAFILSKDIKKTAEKISEIKRRINGNESKK